LKIKLNDFTSKQNEIRMGHYNQTQLASYSRKIYKTKKTTTTHLSHLLAPSSAICSDPPQAYDSFFSDIDNKQIKGQAQS
jgi:hypothetical protein